MARNGMFSRRRRNDFSQLDSHQVHVLAVDDSLVDRKVIERLLKITSCKAGPVHEASHSEVSGSPDPRYAVTAVDSGRRALQFLGLDEEKSSAVGFNGLKVDMIITDYCMPGMTGYELLKRIKGSSTFREVPVVIMSSENVVARIDRCLEEGAEDFIVKPVQLSDVKRLKDYMFGENQMEVEDKVINKRKLQDMSDLSFSPSPPLSPAPSPPSTSTSPSQPLSTSTSPPLSPSPSPSPSSISPSPSPLSISPSPSPPSISPITSSFPQLPTPQGPQPSTPCLPFVAQFPYNAANNDKL